MNLIEIIIENYRGYKNEHHIKIDQLTAFIGKNDVGKSTIFDALAVFFEHPLGKIDSSDICVQSESIGEIVIGCIFSNYPKEIIIDASSITSLNDEYLLNEDGYLEIHKRYDYSDKILKKPQIFAHAYHPKVNEFDELLTKKNTELKKIGETLGIDDEIDKRSNAALRKAIWSKYSDPEFENQLIDLNKEDAKTIWQQISKYLPEYAIFKADRPSTDEDSEVQDPLKVAIDQAIQEVQNELDIIEEKVKSRTLDVANRTIKKLSEFDKELASQLNPNFKSDPKWSGLFKITLTGDDDIPINKRGSGIRRLILFSFFRAEVERLKEFNNKGNIIYAIEEPETAQHPDNQCRIIESLQRISETDGCQILLTTHVPALASLLPIESIRYIDLDNENGRKIQSGTDEVYNQIVSDLGIIPDKRVKVIICVEGPHDINFLKRINAIISNSEPDLINIFTDPRVAFVVLGGSTLKEWVNSNYLKNLNLPEVHIYDRDELISGKYKYQDAAVKVNKRGNGSIAYLTKKREMENYLHLDAINEAFNGLIPANINFCLDDNCDVETEIITLLGQGKINRRSIKHWLNEDAADFMTVDYLKERNGYDEVKGWFIEISNIIR